MAIRNILPTQHNPRAGSRLIEPHRRLMAAVLLTVVDDCRGSRHRRAGHYGPCLGSRDRRKLSTYVASTDRTWPFSFENLCEGLDVDAGGLRRELKRPQKAILPPVTVAYPPPWFPGAELSPE